MPRLSTQIRTRRVLSFVLWGKKPRYIRGAVENAKEAARLYPGWECVFHVAGELPVIPELVRCGAVIKRLPAPATHPAGTLDWRTVFARLHPLFDSDVERVIFRDCDSRISERDAAAVADWIAEGTLCHRMKDHIDSEDHVVISTGCWGLKGDAVPNFKGRMEHWLKRRDHVFDKGELGDETFISEVIWPLVKHSCTVHGFGGKPMPAHAPTKDGNRVGGNVFVDAPETLEVLHAFNHGLGDAVQFGAVLRHLAYYHPDWINDVVSLTGKETAFGGLCRASLLPHTRVQHDQEYDLIFRHGWHECHKTYADYPSTKTVRCLIDEFHLTPIKALLRYQIHVRPEAYERAMKYVWEAFEAGGKSKGGVLLHYQGNTSQELKNMSHEQASQICDTVIKEGFTPIILDWDRRSPLPDNKRIFCPDAANPLWGGTGTGDAETIAALARLSRVCVGIDSGPQKVFLSTEVPTLCYWTGHHPLHYADLADNAVHLIPSDHLRLVRGDKGLAEKFLADNYATVVYQSFDDVLIKLQGMLQGERPGKPVGAPELVEARTNDGALFWIRADNRQQDLCVLQDVYEQDAYHLGEMNGFTPRTVVDIGAHIGSFTRLAAKRWPDAAFVAVEVCPENIPALNSSVPARTQVINAACTYEKDIALLNSVFPYCESTGGSIVTDRKQLEGYRQEGYWPDARPIKTITLEEIIQRAGMEQIDLLKLDCEGCEFSILNTTTSLDKIKRIVGEWHEIPEQGAAYAGRKWNDILERHFQDWEFRVLKTSGNFGTFWLTNKNWKESP